MLNFAQTLNALFYYHITKFYKNKTYFLWSNFFSLIVPNHSKNYECGPQHLIIWKQKEAIPRGSLGTLSGKLSLVNLHTDSAAEMRIEAVGTFIVFCKSYNYMKDIFIVKASFIKFDGHHNVSDFKGNDKNVYSLGSLKDPYNFIVILDINFELNPTFSQLELMQCQNILWIKSATYELVRPPAGKDYL